MTKQATTGFEGSNPSATGGCVGRPNHSTNTTNFQKKEHMLFGKEVGK
jgi:hypothetical protein